MQPIIQQKNDLVAIVAIDMGLKSALFDELLLYDSWLIGLGAMCILYCILIYTNSILITLSTVVANMLSIGVAYFIYQVVFQLPYFPFMNLLAIIIIVGRWMAIKHNLLKVKKLLWQLKTLFLKELVPMIALCI